MCNLQEIEIKIHFLFECPCCAHIKQPWLQLTEYLNEKHANFKSFNVDEKLCLLFDKFHRCAPKFFLDCFKHRKDKLFVTLINIFVYNLHRT